MEPNIEANLLFEAVETIMDPLVSVEARRKAYEICEQFKEKSPLCAHCGLLLSSKENPPVVRHFGLQLIEHHIKFKWNVLNQQEKVSLKQNAMNLLTSGTNFILDEETHIKDAMARIIVEMIKREWPQQWPELLSELNDLCAMGPTQKELVCLIFLRLAEDVVTLQTVQNQRRRELYQALTGNLEQIFAFFVSALNGHYSEYRSLKCDPEDQQKAIVHCRLTNTILFTLAGFVEWVPLTHITADNSILLQILWRILEDDVLQLGAIECLLLIAGRKGKTDERKPILKLFSEDAMNLICSATGLVYMAPATDPKYTILKKLCQLFIALGGQLCALWVPNTDFIVPSTFLVYLNTVLSFTKHPSQVLSRYTQSLWTMFFNHKGISEDKVFKSVIPAVVESCMDKLVKVGFPSRNDYPSCFYSKSEFDSDEDFNGFFGKFRSEICDTLRCATVANPTITFEYASERLYKQLKKNTKAWENEFCTFTTPVYLEWEALANCLESVMGRIPLADPSQASAQEGIKLLGAVLSYETEDPLILSSVISCISALHEFLTLAPEQLLRRVLEKLFVSVVFSQPGQTKATRSKAVKNVRRHACSFLVKISKQQPRLLLPHFKSIYDYVKNISSDPDQLSQMEKCTLIEALILISNEFHEYDHQSSFLKDILEPVYSAWQNAEAQQAFLNIDGFMTHIGLNREPVPPSVEDTKGINRSQMTYCLNTMLGVIRRTRWPDDREIANKGGYIYTASGRSDATHVYFRNPAKPHIYPLLEKLLRLASILNTLWEPESRSKIHPGFITALDILEAEKNMILGLTTPPETMDSNYKPLDRMQYFLSTAHDSCYHILGNCGPSLGVEFYAAEGLAHQIITHIFANLQLVPDYRLRPVIRVFLKPFIQYCPTEYEATAVIPILEVLCPFMYKRLVKKWSAFLQRSNSRDSQSMCDSNETQEVLEDQLNRQLSRDYLDVLGAVLTSNKKVLEVNDEMMDDDAEAGRTPSQSDSLSELGIKALKNKVIWPSAALTVFNGLHWQDTLMCIKCIPLCVPILKQLLEDHRITQEAEASFFLQCVLLGLKELGEHATNEAFLIGLGVQIYEVLRPHFPCLRNIMLECPSCNEKGLECFEEKILNVPVNKQVSEKKKKDMFRKLVNAIIGVNVGQRHKNPVCILNLPPIKKKQENMSLFDIDKEEHFLDLLYELRN